MQIIKVFNEGCASRNNHRYAIVVRDSANQWIKSSTWKNQNFTGNWEELSKVLGADKGNQKSFTLTVHWSLAKPVTISGGIIVRRHLIGQKQMGLLREHCAELKKGHLLYCCNHFWTANGGRIPWNVPATCEICSTNYLMGRHHTKGVSVNNLIGLIVPFGSLVEYHPKSTKDQSRIQQFGKKVPLGIFLDYVWNAGGIWNWDILVVDLDELEEMDASEVHAERLNAKEVISSQCGEKCKFSVADGTVQPYGGDQALRSSILIRNQLVRGESRQDFLDESEGSPPTTYFQDSYPDADEARDDFWSISGDFIYRHHVEPRVKLFTPREELFPISLKNIDVTRVTHTTVDVLQEKPYRW